MVSTCNRRLMLRAATVAFAGAASLPLAPLAWAQTQQNPDAAKVLAEIGKATFIPLGQGSRALYVFFDANDAPVGHKLFMALQPWAGKDGLQVRWVPVAVMSSSSMAKGAAILQAQDRLAALRDNYIPYVKGQSGGGIAPATHMLPQTADMLNGNNALFMATRARGVPTLLYRDKQGGPMLFEGLPDAQQLESILRSVQ